MIDFRPALFLLRILLCGYFSVIALPSKALSIAQQLTTNESRALQLETRQVVDILQNHHYSRRAFRKIKNKDMVSRFIEELDPQAYFLTKEDVRYIHSRFDRTLKTVYLFRGDLRPAFEIFDLFAHRAKERIAWINKRLERDFDLTDESTFQEPEEFHPTPKGLPSDEKWEQRLKDQLISNIIAGRSLAEARTHLAERYVKTERHIAAFDPFAIRERFFDSIIRSFDPHSGYFSADSTREFEISMGKSVIGIGLDLKKEDGLCVVAAVQPGSPADLHSNIATGDRIIAIAEGDAPLVKTSKIRLREIVETLRGAEKAPIRVCYQPVGSDDHFEISLNRERVMLATGRASGAVSEVADQNGKIREMGWITLPDFYAGGEGEHASSAAKDIKELLDQMIAIGVDGVVIDLRDNGGGTLEEAVAVSQLFVPCGHMMLSRGLDGKIVEHTLEAESPAYSGPLIVLTSEKSASASEIFAGAMQHHQRAIIVGSMHTYGKGTAQSYIYLATIPGVSPEDAKNRGTLRLTFSQFFQPDGQPIQQNGITSDIVVNTFRPSYFRLEKDLPHALPAASVFPPTASPCPPKNRAIVTASLIQALQEVATTNMNKLPEWELWRGEQNYQIEKWEPQPRSLHLETRERKWEGMLAEYQSLQEIRRQLTTTSSMPTQALNTSSVEEVHASHQAKLHTLETNQGEPILHRLHHGRFYIHTDQGRLRGISLADFEPVYYYNDAITLSEAFVAATKHPFTEPQAFQVLRDFSLLESRTQPALLRIVDEITAHELSEGSLRSGTEAMLKRMTELHPEMQRSQPGLDVPLRECLRLSAAWAGYVESSAMSSDNVYPISQK